MPDAPLPEEISKYLGSRKKPAASEIRERLKVAIYELANATFPGKPVNLNCELAPYDEQAVNVYIVDQDPQEYFSWAWGNIRVHLDVPNVIIFGQHFEEFFRQAWRPILALADGATNPVFFEGWSEFSTEVYGFYLEYVFAHELGHLKLNHRSLELEKLSVEELQRVELDADIHAAKLLRNSFFQVTPQFLGLLVEWMKFQFQSTYGREWTQADGQPFEYQGRAGFSTSSWHVDVEDPGTTHPPFILRDLSMIEALALVKLEEDPTNDWAISIKDLVANLKGRIRVMSPEQAVPSQ